MLGEGKSRWMNDAVEWVTSELADTVQAYESHGDAIWSFFAGGHSSLAGVIIQNVQVTEEGAFLIALVPYLIALRLLGWVLVRVLSRLARVRFNLDPVVWIGLLADRFRFHRAARRDDGFLFDAPEQPSRSARSESPSPSTRRARKELEPEATSIEPEPKERGSCGSKDISDLLDEYFPARRQPPDTDEWRPI